MMSRIVRGFCGYRCDLCPAYIKNVDRIAKKTTIRAGWNTFFGFDVPEERLECVGCDNKGNHLDTDCPVRPCAKQREIQDCSFCKEFESCKTLSSRADIIDEIKKKYPKKISIEEYALFFRPYEGRNELRKQHRKG
jgi:Golgi nucleoside diphosphatase